MIYMNDQNRFDKMRYSNEDMSSSRDKLVSFKSSTLKHSKLDYVDDFQSDRKQIFNFQAFPTIGCFWISAWIDFGLLDFPAQLLNFSFV